MPLKIQTDLDSFEFVLNDFALGYPTQSQDPAVYGFGENDTRPSVAKLEVLRLPVGPKGIVSDSQREATFLVKPANPEPDSALLAFGPAPYKLFVQQVSRDWLVMTQTAVDVEPNFGPRFAKAWDEHCRATWPAIDTGEPANTTPERAGSPLDLDSAQDTESTMRMIGMLERMRKDMLYRLTVPQAITAFERGFVLVEPPHYRLVPGGTETRWLDIYRDNDYRGRISFTPKLGGTACRLNWFGDSEQERIGLMALLDFHAKELETELEAVTDTPPALYTGPASAGLTTNFTSDLQTKTNYATSAASAGTTADGTKVHSYEPDKLDPDKARVIDILLGLDGATATTSENAAPGTRDERPKLSSPDTFTKAEDERRRVIVTKANELYQRFDKPTWQKVADELGIPERTLRQWRHNPKYQ